MYIYVYAFIYDKVLFNGLTSVYGISYCVCLVSWHKDVLKIPPNYT